MSSTTKERIQFLDALRGGSILLVVAYHFGYNLVLLNHLPIGVLYHPLLRFLQPFFAGLFILLAGISSRLSKNNLKRGFGLLLCALLITTVSYFAGMLITFGILRLLAVCILLYTLLEKLRVTMPVVLMSSFLLLFFRIFQWPRWSSADYFPLVPWGFLFFLGVWLGDPIREGKFPNWFYKVKIPFLPAIGRKTLIIYLAHQPVLFGLLFLFEWAVKVVNS